MARKARKGLLRFAGWFSGSILGTLGVITSGCGWAGTDYGVPSAVNITGTVTSDSQPVQGIQLRMVHNGYPDELDLATSDGYPAFLTRPSIRLNFPGIQPDFLSSPAFSGVFIWICLRLDVLQ